MHTNQNPPKRRYSKRHAAGAVRHAVMALRVTKRTESAIKALSQEFSMSASEYLARMVSDYLNQVLRQRGQLPL